MIISDLQEIVSDWMTDLDNPYCESSYKMAMKSCINDLNKVINKLIREELEYQMAMAERAEDFMTSIEEQQKHAA